MCIFDVGFGIYAKTNTERQKLPNCDVTSPSYDTKHISKKPFHKKPSELPLVFARTADRQRLCSHFRLSGHAV